jgi:signal transduction histidine kinase
VTDDEQVERVERIERATDRMHGLVDDLLTLARSGQAIQETEPVPLVTVVARAWDTVATAGADLEVEASGTLEAEPDRLRQLFENLFRNAVEHGIPGEPGAKTDGGRGGDLADLTVTVDDTEGGFFVADDGRGLLVDDLPLSGPEVTDELDGGGYGLRIVRTIAEAHGWEMHVDESADGGARFEFLT